MKDHLLKRVVVRSCFPVGSVRTILLGPCRGMQIRVSHASGHAVLIGSYDRKAQRAVTTLAQSGATVFDIGANCGQYTLLFATLVGPRGRVVACEPSTAMFNELASNIGLNSLNWVHCEPAAVTRFEGTVRFLSSPGAPTMGKLESADPAITVSSYTASEVSATTIDALTRRWGPPNLIKVDTEGGAGDVLAGASSTAQRFGPTFLIEMHGPVERAAVKSWARAFDYSIADLNGCGIENVAENSSSPVWVKPKGRR